MMSNHYASQPSAHYAYGQPQGPPSPPMDETSKCSLPSISNLLGLADGGSPTTEHSPASQQGKRHRRDQFQRPLTYRPASSQHKSDARPDSSHYNNAAARSGALPPTPPMSSDASFEGYHSPSTKSVSQLSAASNYFYDAAPAMGHVEQEAQRQQMAPRLPIQAPSYAQSAFAASSYMGPPPMASYYPAMQPTPPPQPQVSGLYYQRPLPHVSTSPHPDNSSLDSSSHYSQAFPPMPLGVAMPSSGSNPWQHHHYISPSSAASFPQSQDRYICQTCNKAFSRPSSLRIHSHSHTGEKPFKCPHAGCGKAFSVRSNMKRHERGCHNFETSSNGSPLMS